MSWESDIQELATREALAEEMGGAEKVERQHHFGKLTNRERVDAITEGGSFHEIGKLAGAQWKELSAEAKAPWEEKAVAVAKTTDTSPESVAPTLKALRAWLGTRPEGRMRSGEIDRFFNAHRGLPKPRGIKWLDQYLKQYGMRKRDSGNRSYFFIEVADGSAQ